MEKTLKQNKMGAMPIPKLMLNMGVPMMISMMIQALYNVVDTYFVSQIPDTAAIAEMGDKAINALTLSSPIQMLMIALMVGIGIPSNTLMAKSLGRGDRERANRVAGNALTLTVCIYVLFLLFGLFAAPAFIRSQTKDPVIAEMGITYLRIVTIFSMGGIGNMGIEKVEMGCGNTKATMAAQITGAVTNMVLDPIFIFGWLGLPAMGVRGAAVATVIGQCFACLVLVYAHFVRNKSVDHGLKYLRPDKGILKTVFAIGLPATIMQILTPIMSYGMNLILGAFSTWAVTAFGVYYKLQYFVYMAGWGLNNASIAITSFNFGAKSRERLNKSIQCAVGYVMIIMVVGFGLLQIFARQLVGLFAIAPESADFCIHAVRIASWGLLLGGINVILPGICQALGNGVYSLIVSALRYVVVLLPLVFAFSRTSAAGTLVWAAFPFAELAAFCVAVILTRRLYRQRVGSQGDFAG